MSASLHPAFKPAPATDEDVAAVKAVFDGNASPGQQKAALAWIIWKAAGTYDETFVPAQGDLSDYLQGRRSVGLQLVKLINMPRQSAGETKKGDA